MALTLQETRREIERSTERCAGEEPAAAAAAESSAALALLARAGSRFDRGAAAGNCVALPQLQLRGAERELLSNIERGRRRRRRRRRREESCSGFGFLAEMAHFL